MCLIVVGSVFEARHARVSKVAREKEHQVWTYEIVEENSRSHVLPLNNLIAWCKATEQASQEKCRIAIWVWDAPALLNLVVAYLPVDHYCGSGGDCTVHKVTCEK
jgi:hypothetical protein